MKKIIVVMVVAAFCLTIVGIAAAAEQTKPGTTMQQVPQENLQTLIQKFNCPTGWQKKPGAIACVPSKPAPISCPAGYQYYEDLKCHGTGGMDVCRGCEIGCQKIPQ